MRQSRNILTDKEMELVGLLMQDCQSTGDIQSKLKRLFAGTIEQMLEAEMEEHLGYEKPALKAITHGNSTQRVQSQDHHQRLRRERNYHAPGPQRRF